MEKEVFKNQDIYVVIQQENEEICMFSAKTDGIVHGNDIELLKDINNASVDITAKMNANYFVMSNGVALGVRCGLDEWSVPRQGAWYYYALLKDGTTEVGFDWDFWYTQTDVTFACSPAVILLFHGDYVDYRSVGAGSSKDIPNTQSMLFRLKDKRFGFAVSTGKMSPYDCKEWARLRGDIDDLVLMDSGGSSCLEENGTMIVDTSRMISNCLGFYKTKKKEGKTMESKTPDQFVDEYYGKEIDDDGAYGSQCVDGYRVFCKWAGIGAYPTGTGWADGYWYNRYDQPLSFNNFEFIEDAKELKRGDWCFWAKGSSCPDSHVAMFLEYTNENHAEFFGQNQAIFRGFTIKEVKTDILGAFRWTGWEAQSMKTLGTVHCNVNINIRDTYSTSGNVVGRAEKGMTYDVYGIVQNVGYTWYRIDGGWIANDGNWATFTWLEDSNSDSERVKYYQDIIVRVSELVEKADSILKGE